MRMRKSLSLLVVVMLLSAVFVTPVAAAESGGAAVPKAEFHSIWNHVQEMIQEINPDHEIMEAPVNVKGPDNAEVPDKEEPTSVEEKSVPAPVEERPASAPVQEKPAPVKEKPAPAPVQEKPAPVKEKPAPAPVQEKPAPIKEKPAPAPVQEKPAPIKEKPASDSDHVISDFEKEVVRLVNIEREKEGLKPLVMDTLLSKGARAKSKDMADNGYFSHTSPTYGSPFAMMKSFGVRYSTAGENIASGQRTPAAVVRAWMNSEGHRKNIMSPKYGKIGVGYAYTNGGNYHHYWTQWFTN